MFTPTITRVSTTQLRGADYNPRTWDERALEHVAESIRRFGFVDPLIVNSAPGREGVIIGGHLRWHVAKELGLMEVPVVYVCVPEEERERELNLRLNRNTGEWDWDKLRALFDNEMLMDVGFDERDLERMWNGMLETEDDRPEEAAEEADVATRVQPGETWRLGRHWLACGEPTDVEAVRQLIAEEKPTMVQLELRGGDDVARLEDILQQLPSDTHVFCWCEPQDIGVVQEAYRQAGVSNEGVCLWVRGGIGQVADAAFARSYEPCVYGVCGSPKLYQAKPAGEVLNKEVGAGSRARDDIQDVLDIWLYKTDARDGVSPAERPPTLYEKMLLRCTQVNNAVLDLDAGAGGLLMACEQLRRRALVCEPDPMLCALIINRYEQYTGDTARRAA